jgi:hypothetical protein
MAYPTEKSKRLAELVKQGESSRLVLSEAHARLRHTLDMPSRIRSSITSAPAKWLGGSLVAGFAASLLFRRGSKKAPAQPVAARKPRGFVTGLLALAYTLSKPAVKIYASKLLKDYLTRRYLEGSRDRRLDMRTPPY